MALAGSVAFLFLVIGLHDPVRTKLLACLGLRLRRYWNHTSPDSQRRAPRDDQGGNRIRQQAESSDQGNDRFFGLFAESKRDLIVERAKVGSGSTQDAAKWKVDGTEEDIRGLPNQSEEAHRNEPTGQTWARPGVAA